VASLDMLTKVLKFPKLRFIAKVTSICWKLFFAISICISLHSLFQSSISVSLPSLQIPTSTIYLIQSTPLEDHSHRTYSYTTLPSLHFYHSYTAYQQIGFIFQSRILLIPLCAVSVSTKTSGSPLYAIYASTTSPRSSP
jgi:hypothetical protein